MKNIKVSLIAILLLFVGLTVSAQGNFKPIQDGYAITAPINTEKMAKSIRKALLHYNWVIISDEKGIINAHFEKSNGEISADIRVKYNSEKYSIEYVSSKNLNVDLKKGYIHRNYVRWINNLNKGIYTYYLSD